jgi:hypothetical protein
MNEFPSTLSPQGQRRRQQILALAVAAAGRRRRRNLGVRAGSVCVVCVVMAVTALLLRPVPKSPVAENNGTPSNQPAIPSGESSARVVLIPTDPTLADRLAIPRRPSAVVVIHDRELLDALAQAHQPAGLVYVNGKATLLFQSPDVEPPVH